MQDPRLSRTRIPLVWSCTSLSLPRSCKSRHTRAGGCRSGRRPATPTWGLQVTQSSPSLAVPVEKRLELLHQALLLPVCPPSSRGTSLLFGAVSHCYSRHRVAKPSATSPMASASKDPHVFSRCNRHGWTIIPPLPPSTGRVKRRPCHAIETLGLARSAWQHAVMPSLSVL